VHGRFPSVPIADAGRCAAASAPPSSGRPGTAETRTRGLLTFLSPLLERPDPGWTLVNAKTGAAIATSIETAFDSKTRNKGLLGRDGLPSGSALILAPCSSIHTFFMRFAIDVLFVDRRGVVLRSASNLGPWRIALSLRAFAVIEMPAGTLTTANTRRGDTVELALS
jgi:uncharacterized membrane protein (UPF0127 family)